MSNVLYERNNIFMQAVVVLASAMIRHDNQDSVLKQLKRLNELINPEDKGLLKNQDKVLKDTLRREGAKSYKVEVVKLGERSG